MGKKSGGAPPSGQAGAQGMPQQFQPPPGGAMPPPSGKVRAAPQGQPTGGYPQMALPPQAQAAQAPGGPPPGAMPAKGKKAGGVPPQAGDAPTASGGSNPSQLAALMSQMRR